jgi:hypothetical protein
MHPKSGGGAKRFNAAWTDPFARVLSRGSANGRISILEMVEFAPSNVIN